jgi:hypothetical protein
MWRVPLVEHLGAHVALGALAQVGRACGQLARRERQPQVGDAALAVHLHQDVLRLDVAVGDAWLALLHQII